MLAARECAVAQLGIAATLLELFAVGLPTAILVIATVRDRRAINSHEDIEQQDNAEEEHDIWASYNPEGDGKQHPRSVEWGRLRLPTRNQVMRQVQPEAWSRPPRRPQE